MPDCDRCVYAQDIQWLKEEAKKSADALKDESKKNSDAHQKIYDKLENQGTAQAVIDVRYTAIMQELGELKVAMNELTAKPAKRQEAIINSVLQWLVIGVLGASQFFK